MLNLTGKNNCFKGRHAKFNVEQRNERTSRNFHLLIRKFIALSDYFDGLLLKLTLVPLVAL